MTVTIRPIRNEEQLDAALARVDELIDCEPGSAEAEELEVLSLVVEAYEDKTHPIGPPAPIAAINFQMDQRGLTEKDVQELLGTELTVSELLSKERLTLDMVRKLKAEFGISADSLIEASDAAIE